MDEMVCGRVYTLDLITKKEIIYENNLMSLIFLTGTPALSRPAELHPQLTLIDKKFFSSFTEFSKRYCDGN